MSDTSCQSSLCRTNILIIPHKRNCVKCFGEEKLATRKLLGTPQTYAYYVNGQYGVKSSLTNLYLALGTLVHTGEKPLRTVTPNHRLADEQDDQWPLLALIVKGQRPMALAASPSLPSLSVSPRALDVFSTIIT
jgi:hypothetical protein